MTSAAILLAWHSLRLRSPAAHSRALPLRPLGIADVLAQQPWAEAVRTHVDRDVPVEADRRAEVLCAAGMACCRAGARITKSRT